MSSQDTINHPGRIVAIEGNTVKVLILSQSACSACHAKGACGMTDIQEKIIEVESNEASAYRTGDEVNVVMKQSYGNKAVFYGYFLPLVLVVSMLVLFLSITGSESVAGLISLASLLPYYLVLYFMRHRLKTGFRFYLKKVEF